MFPAPIRRPHRVTLNVHTTDWRQPQDAPATMVALGTGFLHHDFIHEPGLIWTDINHPISTADLPGRPDYPIAMFERLVILLHTFNDQSRRDPASRVEEIRARQASIVSLETVLQMIWNNINAQQLQGYQISHNVRPHPHMMPSSAGVSQAASMIPASTMDTNSVQQTPAMPQTPQEFHHHYQHHQQQQHNHASQSVPPSPHGLPNVSHSVAHTAQSMPQTPTGFQHEHSTRGRGVNGLGVTVPSNWGFAQPPIEDSDCHCGGGGSDSS